MRCVVAFISVVALFSFTADSVSATPLEWEDRALEQSVLSGDVDVFLGQLTRRRSGGGRVWTNAYYGDTRLTPKGEAKIKPHFYGLQLGLDLARRGGVSSTCFFNINQSKTRFSGGNSTIDNYLVGYGKSLYLSMCHFAFIGSIGYDRYAISKDGTNRGNGLQTNFFGEFGLNVPLGKWAIKPFYALQYSFLYHGTIGERRDWNGHGLNQLFGWRLNWTPTHMLELQSRVVWVHEMLAKPPPFYHARFSPVHGIHTPAIMFYEGNTGRNWVWLGIGGRLECAHNVYLFCDYDVLLNERHVTHIGSVGVLLGW